MIKLTHLTESEQEQLAILDEAIYMLQGNLQTIEDANNLSGMYAERGKLIRQEK